MSLNGTLVNSPCTRSVAGSLPRRMKFCREKRRTFEMDPELQLLAEKDAEIERLKGKILELLNRMTDQEREIARLKALITELADALVKDDQNYVWYNEGDELIQRAREATP